MPTLLCSVEGCSNGGKLRRGYCENHYRRALKHGDPLGGHTGKGRPRTSPEHGATGYDYGCRCEVCRAAKAELQRLYKEAFRAVHGVGPATAFRRRFRLENGFAYSTHDSIPISNRRAVYERDGWVCQICFKPIPQDADTSSLLRASVDHVVPRSMQAEPDHSVEALRMAHMICNAMRADNRMTDEEIRRRDPVGLYA